MKIKAVIAGVVLVLAGTAHGQGSDAILDLLIKKGVINQREANDVREQLDQRRANVGSGLPPGAPVGGHVGKTPDASAIRQIATPHE